MAGQQPRRTRRPRRRLTAAAAALLCVLGWAGCAALDRGQSLLPATPQARTGPFVVYASSPLSEDALAVRCLRDLERDIGHELGYRATSGEEPIEIYILNDRHDLDHFLKFYYPELPTRRAFFIAQGSHRVVYTYVSPRLEEDLRHEATHALLRGAYGDLPLWLDEGLAEYFENDLVHPAGAAARAELIAADRRNRWAPDLERLEAMTDVRQMNQRDYREAWGWVHLMLNGSGPGKKILMAYLAQPDRAEKKARLRPLLAECDIDDAGLRGTSTRCHAGLMPRPRPSPPARSGSRTARARRVRRRPLSLRRPRPRNADSSAGWEPGWDSESLSRKEHRLTREPFVGPKARLMRRLGTACGTDSRPAPRPVARAARRRKTSEECLTRHLVEVTVVAPTGPGRYGATPA